MTWAGRTLMALTLAAACGQPRSDSAGKPAGPRPAPDAAASIARPASIGDDAGPRSTLGPLGRARARFDGACPSSLPQGTQPGQALGPYRVVEEAHLSCATLGDRRREVYRSQTFSANAETFEVEHFSVGVDWMTGSPPAECDQLSAAAAAYTVDLLDWPDDVGSRLTRAMAEHLATPDQWFAFSAHDRTIYFVGERVEHQRPLACTVYVSAHLDNWPKHFRAPTPVR